MYKIEISIFDFWNLFVFKVVFKFDLDIGYYNLFLIFCFFGFFWLVYFFFFKCEVFKLIFYFDYVEDGIFKVGWFFVRVNKIE